jgi:ribosomal protein L32
MWRMRLILGLRATHARAADGLTAQQHGNTEHNLKSINIKNTKTTCGSAKLPNTVFGGLGVRTSRQRN